MKIRIFVIILVLAISLPTAAIGQETLRGRMDYVFEVFRSLFYYTANEQRFNDPANREEIFRLVEELRGSFGAHEVTTSEHRKDPGYLNSLESLRRMLDDARHRFSEDRHEYALWRLRSVPGYCITCHVRYEVPIDFRTEAVEDYELSHFEMGQFLMASRQFDKASEAFIRAVEDPAEKLQQMEALRKWMVIYTRVNPDPQLAITTLTRLRSKLAFSVYDEEEIKGWIASLRRWQRESRDVVTPLRRAEALMNQGLQLQGSRSDANGLVELLRSTSMVHKLLERGDLSQEDRGRALYLLGRSYTELTDVFTYEMPEIFLRQCIREHPGTEDAKNCYRVYSQNVTLGYSGSGGTRIPGDIQAELRELYDLAFGIPRLPTQG